MGERLREQTVTVTDQDHVANMVQLVRTSLHPDVVHRCVHTALMPLATSRPQPVTAPRRPVPISSPSLSSSF